MKFIYFTSQKYPSAKADPFFIKSMAFAFGRILNESFTFVVRGDIPCELSPLCAISVKLPKRFRMVLYFLYTPFLVVFNGWNEREAILFSSDPYLLSVLIFWRKIFGFKYFVCSDWHQLFNDWKDSYVAIHSDFLITTSKRLKSLLVSVCGVDSEKILVAYGGVDKSFFDTRITQNKENLRKNLKLPKDSFFVGYVGGFKCMGMDKGVITMIKALALLDKNIKMVFVGAVRKEIEEYTLLAEAEGVANQCIFVGKQSFEKVVEYEMAMDALVIPYPDKPHFRDYGFPMKVWEYMASGRPIIYSNLEIMREVLEKRAFSFDPDSAEKLADVIRHVEKGLVAAEAVAAQNPKDITQYTWDERAQKIISFVEKEIKGNNQRAELVGMFRDHISLFEEQMKYGRSEKNVIKRFFHNIRKLGLSYIFYSMARFGVVGFLKDIKAKLFWGKVMVFPASDVGSGVFSMYGVMPHKSERRLALWLMNNLEETDVFYDIGTHLGYYTALAENMLKYGEVHSFEANNKLCQYLKRNFSNSRNVHVSCVAVADSLGEVDFYDATDIEDSSASSRFKIKDGYGNPCKVPAITLDNYVARGNTPPTVIKLDIEGGEKDALSGAVELIKKYRPRIIMEVWGGRDGEEYSRPAVAQLQEWGYKAFFFDAHGEVSEKEINDPLALVNGRNALARDNFLFKYI